MTVLIVYGDDGLLRSIARSFSGLTCVTATTGEAALAWLNEGVPDLMLVDLDLPDMPAKELITRQKNAGELVLNCISQRKNASSLADGLRV